MKVSMSVVRNLPKARATRGYVPQSIQNTIAIINLERERNVLPLMRERERFWLASGLRKSGGAASSMKQGVVELSCQDMALCVCRWRGKSFKPTMKAVRNFLL